MDEEDRVGVIGFFEGAQLLQPLTEDRDEFAAALQRAGLRIGVAVGGPGRTQLNSNFRVDLVDALKKACGELTRSGTAERRRAIVIFFAGEDPNLSGRLETLRAMLATADARLYAAVVQRTNAPGGPSTTRLGLPPFPLPSPLATVERVSELARESGGEIYRRNADLKSILARARQP